MNLRYTKAALAIPLLTLTLAISASSFAAAPDITPAQRTAVPDRTPAAADAARERVNQEAQGRANSQLPRGTANAPAMHECENSHAPAGTPDLADNENAQGRNPQADENAQGSRAAENQSELGAANSRADVAQAGVNCLDVDHTDHENARGQGTGTTPNAQGNGQTRDTPE